MSAISHFQSIYAQNTKNIPEYYKAIDGGDFATHVGYRMTDDDQIRKFVIMRLMCDLDLDTRAVEKRFAIDFARYFASSLKLVEEFEEEGLVIRTPGKIAIVGAGRLLLRNIAMCFDAYLDSMTKDKPVFSRTV
jgi:oxygen-independent coproporphyrinogen-3 oxidase